MASKSSTVRKPAAKQKSSTATRTKKTGASSGKTRKAPAKRKAQGKNPSARHKFLRLGILAGVFAIGAGVGAWVINLSSSGQKPRDTQASVTDAPPATPATPATPLPSPASAKPIPAVKPVTPPATTVPQPQPQPASAGLQGAPPSVDPIAALVMADASSDQTTMPAWQRNAVSPPPIDGRPMIVLVIDDVGVAQAHAWETVALPPPLTIAFMTYAKDLERLAKAAHANGHELMIHVPMEPVDPKIDPGPRALTVDLAPQEIDSRLDWALSRFSGYVGINNHMGSRFTSDPAGMRLVMQKMKERGLLFLDSKTIASSVGDKLAAEAGIPHIARDIFLDDEVSSGNVWAQLMATEALARRKGYAVAIGHPHPETIAALKQWIPSLKEKGLVLVPLTTIVARQYKN